MKTVVETTVENPLLRNAGNVEMRNFSIINGIRKS